MSILHAPHTQPLTAKTESKTIASADALPNQTQQRNSFMHRVFVLGFWAFLSRFLGLLRDLCIGWCFGAGALGDAVVTATFVPHALRKLLADGVLSLSITTKAVTAGLYLQRRLFSLQLLGPSLSLLLPVSFFLCLIAVFAAPQLVYLIAPGHMDEPLWQEQASHLFRLAAPYVAFVFPAALFMGLLHARQNFHAASAAQICFNFVVLSCLGLGIFIRGNAQDELALGFALGGFVQLIWLMYWVHHADHALQPTSSCQQAPTTSPSLHLQHIRRCPQQAQALVQGVKSIPSVILASASFPLCLLAAMIPSSLSGPGHMTALYFADRLLEVPIGIVGSCMGMASLPELSRLAQQGQLVAFQHHLIRTLRLALVFALPASFGLLGVTPLLTDVLLGHGAFDACDTLLTTYCLYFLAPVLPACILVRCLIAACHAMGFLRLACISTVATALCTVSTGLSLLILMPSDLGFLAGPAAASFCLWLQCFFLLAIVLMRSYKHSSRSYPRTIIKTVIYILRLALCGSFAGLGSQAIIYLLAPFLHQIPLLIIACLCGALSWLLGLFVLSRTDFHYLFRTFLNKSHPLSR